MKTRIALSVFLALVLILPVAQLWIDKAAAAQNQAPPRRPEGPGDIYAAAGCPCVAAHSTTRALYASYNGPLYQILRQSDGKTLDIGVVQPVASPVPDSGGYADAAAQDAFLAGTYGWITKIYDQSGHGNDLVQAPRGGFSGPAMGGFNNLPLADMAPVTIMGHKVYGVFIEPGMGLRWNDARGTAVDDQAEGQYWVINGRHFNSGCCFDYGNAETDSRDDGNGTMETTYYGNATPWYHGKPPGPWVMTDQENNLVGCVNPDGSKLCPDLPSITWRFVTAIAKGESHHWTSMGGDAQSGDLKVMFDGPRVDSSYDPMRKQGAILLGNGGDNSNGSQGTFYEGAMTVAGTFPSDATDQKVQANVVAAKYDLPALELAPASDIATPPGLQTFTPGSSQDTTLTFRNTIGKPAAGVKLNITVPSGWNSVVSGTSESSKTFTDSVVPGSSVSATFKITAGPARFNGDLVGHASWSEPTGGGKRSETTAEKVRNVSPVKLNEFAIGSGAPADAKDSFIELYNAGPNDVDISGWTLTEHATQQPIFSSVKIPTGTKLATHGFYLLGLSTSGLAVPAGAGDSIVHVRSTAGLSVGDTVEIDTGSSVETRKIASIGTPAGNSTTLWQPLPDGPVITLPVGSTNVPFTEPSGFFGGADRFAVEVGEKIGIGYGATYPAVASGQEKYEVVTVTAVGKPGTQAYLAANAKAGDTKIMVTSAANISAGDQIRLDIESFGHGIETVTVTRVEMQPPAADGGRGGFGRRNIAGTLELSAPLKFNHAANIPFSNRGTGISFEPPTAVAHSSNEPILPLGIGITLDKPLAFDHPIDAVVRDAAATTAGYQGPPSPQQWFGGPALSPVAGTMVLRDSTGLVVDSLNYGGLVDPWAAEGYQGTSGAGASGCFVRAPAPSRRGFGRGGLTGSAVELSSGRFPDGADTDDNARDFLVQTDTTLSAESSAGANNIKVASVADFAPGQSILIDSGANRETAVIATVGTSGGTTMRTATDAGVTVVPVSGVLGFSVGQTITIGTGAKHETAVISSIFGGRRGFGPGGGGPGNATITVTEPLAIAHPAGTPVSGTGMTLTTELTQDHETGVPIASHLPTPGAPNQYDRRSHK